MTKLTEEYDAPFSEEDVIQWKKNPVTEAFVKALSIHIEGAIHALCNVDTTNLTDFGRLQGRRFAYVDLRTEMLDPSYKYLKELYKPTDEEPNDGE